MIESATLGMCVLCLSRLVLQGDLAGDLLTRSNQAKTTDQQKLALIIAAILVLFTWLNLGEVVMAAHPIWQKVFIASIPVTFYLMLPLIYFYQQLVVGNPVSWQRKHTLPTALAALLSASLLLMPNDDFTAMFFGDGTGSMWISINALFFAVMFALWLGASIAYIVNMIRVSKKYQQKLSESFSNFSGKTLNWFAWFVGLVCFTWVYAVVALLAEDTLAQFHISAGGVSWLVLLIVWFFSLHSIQQKPVFSSTDENDLQPIAELNTELNAESNKELAESESPQVEGSSSERISDEQVPDQADPAQPSSTESNLEQQITDNQKPEEKEQYSNSALDSERLTRIASKISQAIEADKLYLNPDLTAAELAKHLGISAHYLSQAFTQELKTSFYNYVNASRIRAAKQQLTNSENTVLDIALNVGFNSRSAFYNAFKKDTGMTPSVFRKQGR